MTGIDHRWEAYPAERVKIIGRNRVLTNILKYYTHSSVQQDLGGGDIS